MNIALTHTSGEELDRIIPSNFTPAMAAEYLKEDIFRIAFALDLMEQ